MRQHKIRFNWLLFDLAATGLALYLASLLRYLLPFSVELPKESTTLDFWVYLLTMAIWAVSLVSLDVYDYSYLKSLEARLKAAFFSVGLSTVLLAGALYLVARDVARVLFLYFVIIDLIFLLAPRLTMLWLARLKVYRPNVRKTIIIGAGELGRDVASRLSRHRQVQLLGFLDDELSPSARASLVAPLIGGRDDLLNAIDQHKPHAVIIALPVEEQAYGLSLVIELQKRSIEVIVVPDLQNSGLVHSKADDVDGMLLINLNEPRIRGLNRLMKRILDVTLASIALFFLWPVMLLIAVLIRLDSSGPALFTQIRVGECCRLFKIYKFRTMVSDADARLHEVMRDVNGTLVHKHRDDPRITKLGRFLRKTSLDELPNLFNVLRGEMSLVGPRPELPQIVASYKPMQFGRFSVQPGMTGWWQINGRSDKPLHLHTSDDLYYIEHYSIMLDIIIIFRTVGVLINRKGAF